MSIRTPEMTARLAEIRDCALVIPRKHLAVELELMVSKWPAYRFMSPMAATRQFWLDYIQAYKNSHEINVDLYEAAKLKIAQKLDFRKNNSHLTQMWRARQLADEFGMPYPAYLEFCFDFAMRRQRKQPPQPNQLGPNPKTEQAWSAALVEFWTFDRRSIELARMRPMAQYFVGNDMGLPAQRAFRDLLLEIGADPEGSFDAFVGKRVVALGQLSEADCIGLHGADALAAAIRSAHSSQAIGTLEVHSYQALTGVDRMQACLGVPGIRTAENPVCATCRHIKACDGLRAHVLKGIERETGQSDPLEAKRLAGIKARTAKSRAKARREKQQRLASQCRPEAGAERRAGGGLL